MRNNFLGFLLFLLLLAGIAIAQSTVQIRGKDTASPAAPQDIRTDTSGRIITSPTTATASCTTKTDTVTSVGVTAVATPAADQASRTSILLCNSSENTGAPLVKCRGDGTNPAMGNTTPGIVLNKGDCVVYNVASIKCISDTAATAVSGFECGP